MELIYTFGSWSLEMATSTEWMFMALLLVCFISAGIFGGISLWSLMKQRTKPLYWSVPLAVLSALSFIIIMFYFLL
ncbi:hypothetical protein JCM19045_3741 [Bacillus sp. JCM 19045]|uniref:CHASE2 domain-containing sensor protein n=1 Tax=Shouchella xiaoxiensis TaxID=766895 RepID=A0ABS2SXH7_9BACI|nr:CHASE2 domain-containing sensor protein [Shouchella xiaoxiensis]GAF14427.1 hypothetical protein JCM19045_3741 [Bacillus sp. JCM 19045]